MFQFSRNLLSAFIVLSLTAPTAIFAEPMRAKVDKKTSKSHHYSYKRYEQNPALNHYSGHSPILNKQYIYKNHKQNKRRLKPDVIYVLPTGSSVLIYNGNRYYRWQDRYYQPVYLKGQKAYISVNLSF
ncbi:MAG: hypothetical protein JXR18_12890 [Neptuniibacter sp.]